MPSYRQMRDSSSSSFLACNSRLRMSTTSSTETGSGPYPLLHAVWDYGIPDPAVRCSAMWCRDILVVSSSLPEGELTGSSGWGLAGVKYWLVNIHSNVQPTVSNYRKHSMSRSIQKRWPTTAATSGFFCRVCGATFAGFFRFFCISANILLTRYSC